MEENNEEQQKKTTKILVVVDCQNDFITGSLSNMAAEARVPNIVRLIETEKFDHAVCTLDTHCEKSHVGTQEWRKLPIMHCIRGTDGWKLNKDIEDALLRNIPKFATSEKSAFGSMALPEILRQWCPSDDGRGAEITFVGFCTDICVVSNVLITKAVLPEADIKVVDDCTAGTTPLNETHAIETMRCCQVEIV